MNEQITEPVATPEVEMFLGFWEQYNDLVQSHRWPSLERYGRSYMDVIAFNDANAQAALDGLNPILELGEAMKLLGEHVAKDATDFKSAQYDYRRAVEDEANKPRNEWEEAKRAIVKALEKEEHSLAIKLGRLSNKRFRGTDIEKAYIEEQWQLLDARQTIVKCTLSDIRYMSYSEHEGTEFTMDLVVQAVKYRREYINELIAKFDVSRLIEVAAE